MAHPRLSQSSGTAASDRQEEAWWLGWGLWIWTPPLSKPEAFVRNRLADLPVVAGDFSGLQLVSRPLESVPLQIMAALEGGAL